MKKFTIYFLAVLFFVSVLRGDSFTLSFFQSMTDNLFQTRYPEEDQISWLNFYWEKVLPPFSLFTEGNYSYLLQNSNLSYYFQTVGLDYLYPLNEKTALYFSLEAGGAFYRSDYNDFNYFSLNFLSALKTYLTPTSILKSSSSLEYKNYKLKVFDFISHSLSLSFDKYFQTKTTLQAEIDWGYKYFLHPYFSEVLYVENERSFYQGGRGKAAHSGRSPYLFTQDTQNRGEDIQNISISGLFAQGISDNIGLRLTALKQWNVSGKNPFTSIEEYYMVENPFYDNFSWKGLRLSAQLTLETPWNSQMKIGYTISKKEFPGIESLSIEGTSLGSTRSDRRREWGARIEKNFPRFSFFLAYTYINNHSNDPIFDWNGHFISGGIEWALPFGGEK